MSAIVQTFEQFATANGAHRGDMGDAGTHKRSRRQSDKQWQRMLRPVNEQADALLARRDALRMQYAEAVERGDVRPPTRLERLQAAAAGHPDLPATQAARRILARMGEAA